MFGKAFEIKSSKIMELCEHLSKFDRYNYCPDMALYLRRILDGLIQLPPWDELASEVYNKWSLLTNFKFRMSLKIYGYSLGYARLILL